jgi:hypothetical protein
MCKRWIPLLTAAVLIIQLTACGNTQESATVDAVPDIPEVQIDFADLPELTEEELETEASEMPAEEYVYEPADLSCELPSGFEEYGQDEGVYVYKTYPKDISTISYVISESDEDITLLKEEEYKELLEKDFLDAYGDEVEITILSYDKIVVDKRPGLRIKMEYDFKGTTYEQLVYNIYNGDETHSLNYTQEKGGDWMEAFEKSGESLHFVETD